MMSPAGKEMSGLYFWLTVQTGLVKHFLEFQFKQVPEEGSVVAS